MLCASCAHERSIFYLKLKDTREVKEKPRAPSRKKKVAHTKSRASTSTSGRDESGSPAQTTPQPQWPGRSIAASRAKSTKSKPVPPTSFKLDGRPHVALHNLLQLEGWCESGGTAKNLIAAGNVTVDGQVELRRRCKIVAGQTVRLRELTVQVGA